ncbi:OLC1v1013081C1 [Oldenlandia corymbosa var. corymbosa]|uniref:OLC1v1013081C1 n=1 Tax=Oldenlandia corymbosa var. corymbosa TaxID=529605 RepID=A0AAV1DXE4_OLDCO|nr:OLC1v1013081C1 [Oldenlandia corymbosa var. corymbosa]
MPGADELCTWQPHQEVDNDCIFEWDENSQLYYHSSSGFYYNPYECWYYSSRYGSYYKFENGNYVPLGLENDQANRVEMSVDVEIPGLDCFIDKKQGLCNDNLREDCEDPVERIGTASVECLNDDLGYVKNQTTESLAPPSEWLEDTLIDLYLSGYPNQAATTPSDEVPIVNSLDAAKDGEEENGICGLEEGERIIDDHPGSCASSQKITDEGVSLEEENWLAQYGQVTEATEISDLDAQIVDLWDWEIIRENRKDGKTMVVRLVGRLVKSLSKLHPSVSSGRVRLKTAPICEAHLDLISVTSGQMYRLRRPSLQHLASVSTYDSANPSKDWGFPQLSTYKGTQQPHHGHNLCFESSASAHAFKEEKQQYPYRDRAAERRALHGGFGVGPGQKKALNAASSAPSSPTSDFPEAAAKSNSISFGAGSYARKLLEGMGWKEGEALGKSTKGFIEQLQAVGNKGNAGLGWDNGRKMSS